MDEAWVMTRGFAAFVGGSLGLLIAIGVVSALALGRIEDKLGEIIKHLPPRR